MQKIVYQQMADIKLALFRLLAENLLIFLLQYTGLVISSAHLPIQFAMGTACAFIFLRGYSILPGIWLGSLVAYYFLHVHGLVALGNATVLTLQVGLLYWVSCKLQIPTLIFYQKKALYKFIAIATIITSLSSAIIVRQHWLAYELAILNGIITIAFALIAWDAFYPQLDALKKYNKSVFYITFGLLILSAFSLFFVSTLFLLLCCAILNLLIILWIKYHYGWCGAVSALFLSGLLLSFGTWFLSTTHFSWFLPLFIFIEALIVIS